MRTKSLVAPTGVAEGHEWLSPDGHVPSWHKVFQDGAWASTAYEDPNFPKETGEDKEEDDTEEETEETKSTEETTDEHGMQTAVPDRNGGKQGTGGEPGRKHPADGKQGKGGSGKKRK